MEYRETYQILKIVLNWKFESCGIRVAGKKTVKRLFMTLLIFLRIAVIVWNDVNDILYISHFLKAYSLL